jgi:hypothetical protein
MPLPVRFRLAHTACPFSYSVRVCLAVDLAKIVRFAEPGLAQPSTMGALLLSLCQMFRVCGFCPCPCLQLLRRLAICLPDQSSIYSVTLLCPSGRAHRSLYCSRKFTRDSLLAVDCTFFDGRSKFNCMDVATGKATSVPISKWQAERQRSLLELKISVGAS